MATASESSQSLLALLYILLFVPLSFLFITYYYHTHLLYFILLSLLLSPDMSHYHLECGSEVCFFQLPLHILNIPVAYIFTDFPCHLNHTSLLGYEP